MIIVLFGTLVPVPLGAILYPFIKDIVFSITEPSNWGHLHDFPFLSRIILGYIYLGIPSLLSTLIFVFVIYRFIVNKHIRVVVSGISGGFWGYFLLDRLGRDEGPVYTTIGIVVGIISCIFLSMLFKNLNSNLRTESSRRIE